MLFALGHSWGSPSYVWAEDRSAVTATRICERDTGHTETEEAGTYRTVASTPTDKDPGTISWVSREFKNEAFTVQTIDGGKMNIFRLPSALRTIEAEALAGVSADAVIVPDGCTVIETGAFANCPNLLYISVPSGVTVPEEATAGSADVMVEQRQY